MIGKLNHVAIAVPDLQAATAVYRDTLGAEVSEPQDITEHGVTVVFVKLPNTKIELLYPLGENSPIAGFLAKNASGGIHHVCYEVPDIYAARDQLVKKGARVLGDGFAGYFHVYQCVVGDAFFRAAVWRDHVHNGKCP